MKPEIQQHRFRALGSIFAVLACVVGALAIVIPSIDLGHSLRGTYEPLATTLRAENIAASGTITMLNGQLVVSTPTCSAGSAAIWGGSAWGCGSAGGGGGITGLTTGKIPKAASSTTLSDSPVTVGPSTLVSFAGAIDVNGAASFESTSVFQDTIFAIDAQFTSTVSVASKLTASGGNQLGSGAVGGTLDDTAGFLSLESAGHATNIGGTLRVNGNASTDQYFTAGTSLYAGGGPAYAYLTSGAGGIGTAPSLNFFYLTNGVATGYINANGYAESTTQPRNLWIQDGQGSASGHSIAQFDGSTHDVTLPNGNLITNAHHRTTGTAPTLSACGTSTITGNDQAGVLSIVGATGCTLTFASTYTTEPPCIMVPMGTATQPVYTVSATAITATTVISGQKYHYQCVGL